jgi:hypothetical protein
MSLNLGYPRRQILDPALKEVFRLALRAPAIDLHETLGINADTLLMA